MLLTVPVPSPPWLVDALHGLTFVLHTASMHVMVACAFAVAIHRGAAAREGAQTLPVVMSLTITLGVAPLLFLQLIHGERFYASSIYMAWPWMLALIAVMGGYYAAYACEGRHRRQEAPGLLLRGVPFLGLLTFSFVLAANVTLSERPQLLAQIAASGHAPGWITAMTDSGAPLRWAHEMVGAIALGSTWFVVRGIWDRDEKRGAALARFGLRVMIAFAASAGLLGLAKRHTRSAV